MISPRFISFSCIGVLVKSQYSLFWIVFRCFFISQHFFGSSERASSWNRSEKTAKKQKAKNITILTDDVVSVRRSALVAMLMPHRGFCGMWPNDVKFSPLFASFIQLTIVLFCAFLLQMMSRVGYGDTSHLPWWMHWIEYSGKWVSWTRLENSKSLCFV
jgi:hypothetical protein